MQGIGDLQDTIFENYTNKLMTTLKDLRELSKERLEEASILLQKHKYEGAKYLCGYAIEHALKLQICKTLKWKSYPPKNPTSESFGENLKSFRTHNPETLLLLSGRHKEVYNKKGMLAVWDVLKVWNSEIRYEINPQTKIQMRGEVTTMIEAAKKMLRFLDIKL